jgi:HPt (histidine-containing phosphotransfer) domain-containing protein
MTIVAPLAAGQRRSAARPRPGVQAWCATADTPGMADQPRDRGAHAADPLLSEFAGDGDMLEIIEFFIGRLQDRIDVISTAWAASDLDVLRREMHQLKSAAGGCGFPAIGRSAAEIETRLLAAEADAAALGEELEGLIALCHRAAASRHPAIG